MPSALTTAVPLVAWLVSTILVKDSPVGAAYERVPDVLPLFSLMFNVAALAVSASGATLTVMVAVEVWPFVSVTVYVKVSVPA